MPILLFAAQHLPLKHPSVQRGSPQDTSGGVTSTSQGLAAHRGERSRPASRPGCVTAAGQTQHGPWLQNRGQRRSAGSSTASQRRRRPRAIAICSSAVGCQLINFAWD